MIVRRRRQVSLIQSSSSGDALLPDVKTIMLFSVAAIALLLVPGPVVLCVIARSINQGRRTGFMSVLGAGVGDFGHVLAATLGLSAILLTSALAFNVVKYAGSVYLIYLGYGCCYHKLNSQHQLLGLDST